MGLPDRHPAVLLATWFGAGFLPKMPGTWGSLAALPLAWLLQIETGRAGLLIAAALVFAVGCRVAGQVARAATIKDPSAIVIDEVAAQWLVLAAGPPHLASYASGFVLFRLCDIVKPWPASWADRSVSGGLGIMLDDLFAAFYAGSALFLLARFGLV